ncbi:hypothetical protein X975_26679, partial [Stegodyphus mimosarum]
MFIHFLENYAGDRLCDIATKGSANLCSLKPKTDLTPADFPRMELDARIVATLYVGLLNLMLFIRKYRNLFIAIVVSFRNLIVTLDNTLCISYCVMSTYGL